MNWRYCSLSLLATLAFSSGVETEKNLRKLVLGKTIAPYIKRAFPPSLTMELKFNPTSQAVFVYSRTHTLKVTQRSNVLTNLSMMPFQFSGSEMFGILMLSHMNFY